jgi:hypothetical protein
MMDFLNIIFSEVDSDFLLKVDHTGFLWGGFLLFSFFFFLEMLYELKGDGQYYWCLIPYKSYPGEGLMGSPEDT